jgi:hypothetical protein
MFICTFVFFAGAENLKVGDTTELAMFDLLFQTRKAGWISQGRSAKSPIMIACVVLELVSMRGHAALSCGGAPG